MGREITKLSFFFHQYHEYRKVVAVSVQVNTAGMGTQRIARILPRLLTKPIDIEDAESVKLKA